MQRPDVASACGRPTARELGRPVGVGRVVQVAFGRGDVAVAHHPLDLVDLEHADRLRAEACGAGRESAARADPLVLAALKNLR